MTAMDDKMNTMLPVGRSPASRRSRSRAMIAVALFSTFAVFAFYQLYGFSANAPSTDSWMPKTQNELTQTRTKLVPLEAHIISKCGDTRVSACPWIYTAVWEKEGSGDRRAAG